MDLGLLNILVSVISFLGPFIVSFAIFKTKKIKYALLYSALITIILGSLIAYLIIGVLFP
jgi:hypothetical protein